MVDLLMIVLWALAGLLALALGILFNPFGGVLFWLLLAKNAEDARERAEVKDTLEEEVERQYEILRNRKIAEQDLQEPIAVNVDPYEEWHVEGKCSNYHRWQQPLRHPSKTNVPCPICAERALTLCVRVPRAWYESSDQRFCRSYSSSFSSPLL